MDGTAHPAPVLPLRACVAQTRHNIIIITGGRAFYEEHALILLLLRAGAGANQAAHPVDTRGRVGAELHPATAWWWRRRRQRELRSCHTHDCSRETTAANVATLS